MRKFWCCVGGQEQSVAEERNPEGSPAVQTKRTNVVEATPAHVQPAESPSWLAEAAVSACNSLAEMAARGGSTSRWPARVLAQLQIISGKLGTSSTRLVLFARMPGGTATCVMSGNGLSLQASECQPVAQGWTRTALHDRLAKLAQQQLQQRDHQHQHHQPRQPAEDEVVTIINRTYDPLHGPDPSCLTSHSYGSPSYGATVDSGGTAAPSNLQLRAGDVVALPITCNGRVAAALLLGWGMWERPARGAQPPASNAKQAAGQHQMHQHQNLHSAPPQLPLSGAAPNLSTHLHRFLEATLDGGVLPLGSDDHRELRRLAQLVGFGLFSDPQQAMYLEQVACVISEISHGAYTGLHDILAALLDSLPLLLHTKLAMPLQPLLAAVMGNTMPALVFAKRQGGGGVGGAGGGAGGGTGGVGGTHVTLQTVVSGTVSGRGDSRYGQPHLSAVAALTALSGAARPPHGGSFLGLGSTAGMDSRSGSRKQIARDISAASDLLDVVGGSGSGGGEYGIHGGVSRVKTVRTALAYTLLQRVLRASAYSASNEELLSEGSQAITLLVVPDASSQVLEEEQPGRDVLLAANLTGAGVACLVLCAEATSPVAMATGMHAWGGALSGVAGGSATPQWQSASTMLPLCHPPLYAAVVDGGSGGAHWSAFRGSNAAAVGGSGSGKGNGNANSSGNGNGNRSLVGAALGNDLLYDKGGGGGGGVRASGAAVMAAAAALRARIGDMMPLLPAGAQLPLPSLPSYVTSSGYGGTSTAISGGGAVTGGPTLPFRLALYLVSGDSAPPAVLEAVGEEMKGLLPLIFGAVHAAIAAGGIATSEWCGLQAQVLQRATTSGTIDLPMPMVPERRSTQPAPAPQRSQVATHGHTSKSPHARCATASGLAGGVAASPSTIRRGSIGGGGSASRLRLASVAAPMEPGDPLLESTPSTLSSPSETEDRGAAGCGGGGGGGRISGSGRRVSGRGGAGPSSVAGGCVRRSSRGGRDRESRGLQVLLRNNVEDFILSTSQVEDMDSGILSQPQAYHLMRKLSAPNMLPSPVITLEDVAGPRPLELLVSSARSRLTAVAAGSSAGEEARLSVAQDLAAMDLHEVIGSGGQGVVFRGTLHGLETAVKVWEHNGRGPLEHDGECLSAEGLGGDWENGGGVSDGKPPHPNQPVGGAEAVASSRDCIRQAKRGAMEVAVTATLSHPNIVQTYAHFSDVVVVERYPGHSGPPQLRLCAHDDPVFRGQKAGPLNTVLCLEYCDAGTLLTAARRGDFRQPDSGARDGPVWPDMVPLYTSLLEVALALRYLHSRRLVHCDLKPGNILLKTNPRDARGWTCKLSDFGCVRLMDEGGADGVPGFRMAQVFGTVAYMAPECFSRGRLLNAGVDVFAFGVLMWELMHCKAPYAGIDPKELPRVVTRSNVRPEFHQLAPSDYRTLACRCWSAAIERRPTATQLVSELQQLLAAAKAAANSQQQRRATLQMSHMQSAPHHQGLGQQGLRQQHAGGPQAVLQHLSPPLPLPPPLQQQQRASAQPQPSPP